MRISRSIRRSIFIELRAEFPIPPNLAGNLLSRFSRERMTGHVRHRKSFAPLVVTASAICCHHRAWNGRVADSSSGSEVAAQHDLSPGQALPASASAPAVAVSNVIRRQVFFLMNEYGQSLKNQVGFHRRLEFLTESKMPAAMMSKKSATIQMAPTNRNALAESVRKRSIHASHPNADNAGPFPDLPQPHRLLHRL